MKYKIIELDKYKIPGDPEAETVVFESDDLVKTENKLKSIKKNADHEFFSYWIRYPKPQ